MTKTVYTYYEPLGMRRDYTEEDLIKVCEKFCELINYPGCVVNMNNKPHTFGVSISTNCYPINKTDGS